VPDIQTYRGHGPLLQVVPIAYRCLIQALIAANGRSYVGAAHGRDRRWVLAL